MIKVIAVGNRLMQDDGVAVAVAEYLRNRLESMELEVIIGETDFNFCFHFLEEDDPVILLDAAFTGSNPGSIHVKQLREASCGYGRTGSTHEQSIFDLMRLYSKTFRGYLIGIEISEAGFGCELSDSLNNQFDGICLEVERIINGIVKEERNARHFSE